MSETYNNEGQNQAPDYQNAPAEAGAPVLEGLPVPMPHANENPAQNAAEQIAVAVSAASQVDKLQKNVDKLQKNFERQAEDSFRMAVGSTAETVSDFYNSTTEAYEGAAQAMRASAEGFASAITQLNWKLFEFGRVNAQNNMNFVREVAGVRSMRDLVDVQTAYMRGQYEALTTQLRELQTLTTELAGKTSEPFKEQIARTTQLPRIC